MAPAFDLVVRGGTVVDGTGAEPVRADVAVRGATVAAVGAVTGRAEVEIDATGLVVTPGFVDIHTHYDGQATWSPRLQPSSLHGVTTVVMGNCGVGFAPVRPADRARVIELMEGVEDIPGTALHEGLPWDWESFGDYLDVLERRAFDVDVATQVPHAALRVHVMGERALAMAPADESEVAAMGALAAEAVRAGALGFTTSQTRNHRSLDGEHIPSYGAPVAELSSIARAVGATGRGVLQLIVDLLDVDADVHLVETMARSSGRPISFSLMQDRANPTGYRAGLDLLDRAGRAGLPIRAQVGARALGVLHGLACSLHAFMTNEVWLTELAHLPVAEQARRMRDPAVERRVLAAQTDEVRANVPAADRIHRWDTIFDLGDPPCYEPPPSASIAAMAARLGTAPEKVVYDILAAGDGAGLLYQPFTNYADGNLDAVREMLVHPGTIPGLSDGGAHVGTICDASFPTTLVAHWTRDRATGRLPLEFVVHRQTAATARAVGLLDRGVLAPGYRADLNVVDLDELRVHRPEVVEDLPAGGRRLMQRASGYRHTFVAGIETYRDGAPTAALPGRLVRGGSEAVGGTC